MTPLFSTRQPSRQKYVPGSIEEKVSIKYKEKSKTSSIYYVTVCTRVPPLFMHSTANPSDEKETKFSSHQKARRKDIERSFGVLQATFHIIALSSRLWRPRIMDIIMYCCVIIHNNVNESSSLDRKVVDFDGILWVGDEIGYYFERGVGCVGLRKGQLPPSAVFHSFSLTLTSTCGQRNFFMSTLSVKGQFTSMLFPRFLNFCARAWKLSPSLKKGTHMSTCHFCLYCRCTVPFYAEPVKFHSCDLPLRLPRRQGSYFCALSFCKTQTLLLRWNQLGDTLFPPAWSPLYPLCRLLDSNHSLMTGARYFHHLFSSSFHHPMR